MVASSPLLAEVHQLSGVEEVVGSMTYDLARPVNVKRSKRGIADHGEVTSFRHCSPKASGKARRQETPQRGENKVPAAVDLVDLGHDHTHRMVRVDYLPSIKAASSTRAQTLARRSSSSMGMDSSTL